MGRVYVETVEKNRVCNEKVNNLAPYLACYNILPRWKVPHTLKFISKYVIKYKIVPLSELGGLNQNTNPAQVGSKHWFSARVEDKIAQHG